MKTELARIEKSVIAAYSGSHAVISNGMSILHENVFQIHKLRANIVFQLQNTNDFC